MTLPFAMTTSPSTDYLLLPKLSDMGLLAHTDPASGLLQGINPSSKQPEVSIVCRYVNAKKLQQLRAHKRQGIKSIYFMDDDLLDPLAWGGLPWRYRFKLFTKPSCANDNCWPWRMAGIVSHAIEPRGKASWQLGIYQKFHAANCSSRLTCAKRAA